MCMLMGLSCVWGCNPSWRQEVSGGLVLSAAALSSVPGLHWGAPQRCTQCSFLLFSVTDLFFILCGIHAAHTVFCGSARLDLLIRKKLGGPLKFILWCCVSFFKFSTVQYKRKSIWTGLFLSSKTAWLDQVLNAQLGKRNRHHSQSHQ